MAGAVTGDRSPGPVRTAWCRSVGCKPVTEDDASVPEVRHTHAALPHHAVPKLAMAPPHIAPDCVEIVQQVGAALQVQTLVDAGFHLHSELAAPRGLVQAIARQAGVAQQPSDGAPAFEKLQNGLRSYEVEVLPR